MLKGNHSVKIDIVKLFITILISCSLVGSQRRGQFCLHNEFRCTDGRCLPTEKLCDGRQHCVNYEDERGDGTWSCQNQVLGQDYCDPATQFKCRFGGCISRRSLCDGQVDCWGGGDEATDICDGGSPVVPQVSGAPAPVNNVRPPTQVIQQTPRPRPTPAPTQRTTRPQSIFTQPTVRSQFPSQSSGGGFGACGPINEESHKGYEIRCENSRSWDVDCANAPEGAMAIYTCKTYFVATSLIDSTTRRCESGQWSQLNRRFSCIADCGISPSETGAFIVGGSTAKAGKWPWMVALYERSSKNPSKLDFICGGSLISARAVVTAAHCVRRRDNNQNKPIKNLKIVMGKYYRSYDRKSTGEQERDVSDIFVHTDYNYVTLNSDIAIIKLSQPVEISNTVRPVCLPQAKDYYEPGDTGTLVGWGRGDGNSFQEQLQQAQLPVVSNRQCIEAHPQFAQLVRKGTFCAGFRNGTSACDGDSGGPLVLRDKITPSKYILHGVVSAGIAASDRRSGCNPNYYTVFTDVAEASNRRWLVNVIDNNFGTY